LVIFIQISSLNKLLFLCVNSDKNFLGAGSFGSVYRVFDSERKQMLAVKKVDLGLVESSEYKKVS